MRAAVFHGAGCPLAVEHVPDPRPADDQIIIEVAYCGICGSDLHVTQYGFAPAGAILGHEFAGTVAEIGKAARGGWKIGDRVTALPFNPCNQCEACKAGLPGLCTGGGAITGTALAFPGAYAPYVAAKSTMAQRLPENVSFTEAALIEPLAVAHHSVHLAPVKPGDAVLVIGAGPIGVAVALFARLAGARHVIVSEPAPARRARALDLGATAVIDPLAENVSAAFEAIASRKPQIVFECVGNPGLIQHAIEMAGLRGRVVVAGACMSDDKITPISALSKEVSIVFSLCYTKGDFAAVTAAIARGEALVQPMHTGTVSLSELPAAFEALRTDPSHCKLLVEPGRH